MIMDYRFSKDLYAGYSVEVDSEQSLFAPWLSEEIATNMSKINAIISHTEALLSKKGWQYSLPGIDLHLEINREEAILQSRDDRPGEELDDGLTHCDNLFTSRCGLEDFLVLIVAWRDFVGE